MRNRGESVRLGGLAGLSRRKCIPSGEFFCQAGDHGDGGAAGCASRGAGKVGTSSPGAADGTSTATAPVCKCASVQVRRCAGASPAGRWPTAHIFRPSLFSEQACCAAAAAVAVLLLLQACYCMKNSHPPASSRLFLSLSPRYLIIISPPPPIITTTTNPSHIRYIHQLPSAVCLLSLLLMF